jgi:hypothetical protein
MSEACLACSRPEISFEKPAQKRPGGIFVASALAAAGTAMHAVLEFFLDGRTAATTPLSGLERSGIRKREHRPSHLSLWS